MGLMIAYFEFMVSRFRVHLRNDSWDYVESKREEWIHVSTVVSFFFSSTSLPTRQRSNHGCRTDLQCLPTFQLP